jgi:D-lactate dehydratase / protein deglycase
VDPFADSYIIVSSPPLIFNEMHSVETLVPMMHLAQAGFGMDICTPTGKDVKLEMWAMPQEDEAVKAFYETKKADLEKPLSLSELMASPDQLQHYIAVFLPGGHGAMLGLPENKDMTQLLAWVKEHDKTMLAICHGPAALLAGVVEGTEFLYKDYEMVAFPDRVDKVTPVMGYIPGHMPWYFGEKLIAAGVKIINKAPNGYVHKDRKLITGDSPKAANAFGKLAAESLLEEVKE